jgi:hypothetical protein
VANIFLAWQNRADEGTLSGGSWLATLPLTNLQNRQVQKVARSTNATLGSTQWSIDLGSARSIGVVSLVVHNISVTGKVRITGADNSGFVSPLYQSAWISVWPSGMIDQSLLEWEDDNFWLGTLSAEARAGYQSPFIHLLPSQQSLRYWKVEIDDTGNSAGYVQVGRLFLAKGWRPSVNYRYGAGLEYEDPTPIDTSLSGAEFFDQRSKYRIWSFNLEYVTGTEAYQYALELQRVSGISGEVLVIPDSDSVADMPLRSFVGRLKQTGAVTQEKPTAFNVPFQIKELL